MGSKVEALFIFGFTLVCSGGFLMLFNDAIERVIDRLWVASDFLTLMQVEWNAIPVIIFIVGIFSLILAGVASRGGREVTQE
jgi:hypothetical protein